MKTRRWIPYKLEDRDIKVYVEHYAGRNEHDDPDEFGVIRAVYNDGTDVDLNLLKDEEIRADLFETFVLTEPEEEHQF